MKLIYRCICMVLGAILGTGCSDMNEPAEYGPGPMPEYGVPTGVLSISGRVVDEQGDSVPGVQVSFMEGQSDTTDAQGSWDINDPNVYFPCTMDDEADCTVAARDIDGSANGGPYPAAEMDLDLVQTEPSSGSWYLGTWQQHEIEIVMTEAEKRKSRDSR